MNKCPEILAINGELSGAVINCYKFGIDKSTGNIYYRDLDATWQPINSGAGSGGTVTSFSFTDSTGITGTVTNPTTTPTLSLALTLSAITSGKPTTLAGYGITDAYPLSGNPSGFLTSVPAQSFASITGKPTTLSGYGITDAALDSAVVHLAGAETITGLKTFNPNTTRFQVGATSVDPFSVTSATGIQVFQVINANSDAFPVAQATLNYGGTATLFFSVASTVGSISASSLLSLRSTNVEKANINSGGVMIGNAGAAAAAKLHLGVGTTTAGTAPLKLTTTGAALLTTPEAGAFETDGTDLYFTNSAGVRKKVTLV